MVMLCCELENNGENMAVAYSVHYRETEETKKLNQYGRCSTESRSQKLRNKIRSDTSEHRFRVSAQLSVR
jgi:hypothetical protein